MCSLLMCFPICICIASWSKIPMLPFLRESIALEVSSALSLPVVSNESLFFYLLSVLCTHQDGNPLHLVVYACNSST
jgi:hypothetical protein